MKTNQQTSLLSMRKILVLIMVSALFIQISRAQDSLNFRRSTYKVIAGTNADNRIYNGYLSSITDTSVYISSLPVRFNGYVSNGLQSPALHYNNISKVRLRRTGSTGRGILIGAIAGAVSGAILGFVSGDDVKKNSGYGNSGYGCFLCFTAGEKAAAGGTVLGVAGSLIGGIVGALAHKTFIINSKKEKFDELKWSLMH